MTDVTMISFKSIDYIIVISDNKKLNDFAKNIMLSLQGLYDESDFDNGKPYCEKIQLINEKYKATICLVKDFVSANCVSCMGCDSCLKVFTEGEELKCFHTGVLVSLSDASLNKTVQDFRKRYYLWYWLFETNEVNCNTEGF